MIPTNDITAWAHSAPWPSPDQVEQDLLLSQLICLIAADDYLGDELVFRGRDERIRQRRQAGAWPA